MLGKRYEVNNVAEVYKRVGKDLLKAKSSSPRGAETKELIAPQIVIKNPRERLAHNSERKYNLFHAFSEAIMLYSTSSKVEHLGMFNKNMKKFSDNGETMYGAYGTRIAEYIPDVVEKLKNDNDSRQAVLTIYDSQDMTEDTKDVPCTQTFQFLLRDEKLHMVTNMRSNDIIYGFQFDVFMFTMLQETIANELEVEVGYYVHQPASLHVYKNYFNFEGYEMLSNMTKKSNSIEVVNNGRLKDWNELALSYTGEIDYKNNGSITDTINILIKSEKEYRTGNKYKTEEYSMAPSWAKPFLSKWINRG